MSKASNRILYVCNEPACEVVTYLATTASLPSVSVNNDPAPACPVCGVAGGVLLRPTDRKRPASR